MERVAHHGPFARLGLVRDVLHVQQGHALQIDRIRGMSACILKNQLIAAICLQLSPHLRHFPDLEPQPAIALSCTTTRRNYCQFSYSYQYCGSNNQPTASAYTDSGQGSCQIACTCNPSGRPQCPGQGTASCSATQGWSCNSPILLPGDEGFSLTSAEDGVLFDLACTGIPQQIAWTEAGNNEGWLVLDRNENGKIDDGSELFGSFALQPTPPPGVLKNGFRALKLFDKPMYGGNNDGFIDSADAVFEDLRDWQDLNHDGVSEASELKTLHDVGVSRIALDYTVKDRVDEHGNAFYYRAKAYDLAGRHHGIFVWDVFLTAGQ